MFYCFLVVFRGMLFANHWGEYSVNPCRFWILLKSASSQSCSKMIVKIWFLEVIFEACVDQFWWKSLSFFNHFAFWQLHDFWWHVLLQRFPSKSKMCVLARTCSKNWWFSLILGRSHAVKYWILAGTCSKSRWNIEYYCRRIAKVGCPSGPWKCSFSTFWEVKFSTV